MGDIGDLPAQGTLPLPKGGPVGLPQLQQYIHRVQQLLRRAIGRGQTQTGGGIGALHLPQLLGRPMQRPALAPDPYQQYDAGQRQHHAQDPHLKFPRFPYQGRAGGPAGGIAALPTRPGAPFLNQKTAEAAGTAARTFHLDFPQNGRQTFCDRNGGGKFRFCSLESPPA